MTLDELQEWEQAQADEDCVACEITGKAAASDEDSDDDIADEAKLEEVLDKILRFFYGKAFKSNKKTIASRKALRKLIAEGLQLEVLQTSYQDLDTALEHLEDCQDVMGKMLRRHPHSTLGPDLQITLEDVSDFLEQWGLGIKET